jgi:predicted MFS family arabinose efflux permease
VNNNLNQSQLSGSQTNVSPWLILLLSTACGLIAANVYYAQPLAGPISTALGFAKGATGLIVTMTQIGTALGLLLIVPMGDLIESRRLTLTLLCIVTLALLGAAWSWNPISFLVSAGFIGLGSVAVHVLVPYAAHLAPEATRGRVVGHVMSGVLFGIMLARPVASLLTDLTSSWHVVFFVSAGFMATLVLVLSLALPPRQPRSQMRYRDLLASMWEPALTQPILRRRSLYHGALGAAFSLFWTTTSLLLAGPAFNLSQGGIALFAFVGVSGAIAAPLAGRMADRGWSRPATVFAMLVVAMPFVMARVAEPGSGLALGLLVAAGVLIDCGVSVNMSLGPRAIFSLCAQYRSRVNGIYTTTFFAGSACGSALGGGRMRSAVGASRPELE